MKFAALLWSVVLMSTMGLASDLGKEQANALLDKTLRLHLAPDLTGLSKAEMETVGILLQVGDIMLGDDNGVVVLPSQMAEELLPECIEHDEIEAALLEYTQERKISPKSFYPFNDDTMKIYQEWKKRQGRG